MTFEGLINQFISAVTSEDTTEMMDIMSYAQVAEFMGCITYEQCDAIVKMAMLYDLISRQAAIDALQGRK